MAFNVKKKYFSQWIIISFDSGIDIRKVSLHYSLKLILFFLSFLALLPSILSRLNLIVFFFLFYFFSLLSLSSFTNLSLQFINNLTLLCYRFFLCKMLKCSILWLHEAFCLIIFEAIYCYRFLRLLMYFSWLHVFSFNNRIIFIVYGNLFLLLYRGI